MKNLQNILKGKKKWSKKLEEIKELGLPLEDFYTHLRKEVEELIEGRNNGEMVDVINTLGMLYVVGNYKVTLNDCYDKLKAREKKYEIERRTP